MVRPTFDDDSNEGNGEYYADLIQGSADCFYGYIYPTEALTNPSIGYSTTEEERIELAKNPFTEFEITFNSYEEVCQVTEKFRDRFSECFLDQAQAKMELNQILFDLRNVSTLVH